MTKRKKGEETEGRRIGVEMGLGGLESWCNGEWLTYLCVVPGIARDFPVSLPPSSALSISRSLAALDGLSQLPSPDLCAPRLKPYDTPESEGLQDGDEIDAMAHQVGGGAR